jgi:polysaccharide export outer membrane protein
MGKHARSLAGLGWAITAGLLLAGCASSVARDAPSSFVVPVPHVSEAEYVIQPRDILSIQFPIHPDHDQKDVLVKDDGKITLPLVGEVQAAGRTPPALSAELVRLYSVSLRNPLVAVNVQEQDREQVWVGGEVLKPGFIVYRPGMTASQALVAAGGPKNTAEIKESVLLQQVGTENYRASKIDLAKVVEEGDTKSDLTLAPRDVLIVPMSGIAKANVWVRQYIINMLPIKISYETPDPNSGSSSSSSDQNTSGGGSGSSSRSRSSSSSSSTNGGPSSPSGSTTP